MRRALSMLALVLGLAACEGPGGPSRNFAGLSPSGANCFDSGSSPNLGGLAAAGVLLGAAMGQRGFDRFAALQNGAAQLGAAAPPRYDGCTVNYQPAQPQWGQAPPPQWPQPQPQWGGGGGWGGKPGWR